MPKLHFGVTLVPYTYGSSGRTTHQVAEILEGKYTIMETFARDNEKEIRSLLAAQAGRYAKMAVKGREPNLQPALDQIKRMFRSYILSRKLDGRVKGVPTKASLLGINHRLKHPYAKRAPRPSFFDTGLYVNAFKAWVE